MIFGFDNLRKYTYRLSIKIRLNNGTVKANNIIIFTIFVAIISSKVTQ